MERIVQRAGMDSSLPPSISTVISLQHQLLDWLRRDALPLWDHHGVDRNSGGYFESLSFNSHRQEIEAAGEIRRGRVVARQIYVFDVGRRLGWRSVHPDPVYHGCDYLFARMHRGDGLFHTSVHARTGQPQAPFNLYEYAFYLFALARVRATSFGRFSAMDVAYQCLRQLRRSWGKSNGGFEESTPATVPLKSNPHMHMLEAALAWLKVSDESQRGPWVELAQELVYLCLARFVDPATGAVREYFDGQWQPMTDETGRIVEPGHQFEWAWLLMQWATCEYCDPQHRDYCRVAARRLVDIGERWGVDRVRDVAINELWDDMTVKDAGAKLWPQTERVKAWCAVLEHARSTQEAQLACQNIAAAVQGLKRYFSAEHAGLWQELLTPDGSFTTEPCKASSFYHIACAVETLHHTLSAVAPLCCADAEDPTPNAKSL